MAVSLKGQEYAYNRAKGISQYESAKLAGYSCPEKICARLEANKAIQAFLAEITEEVRSPKIATARERQEFWTSILRGQIVDKDTAGNDAAAKMSDRLKASELLGKSQMDFVEKRIVELANPGDELQKLKDLALSADG